MDEIDHMGKSQGVDHITHGTGEYEYERSMKHEAPFEVEEHVDGQADAEDYPNDKKSRASGPVFTPVIDTENHPVIFGVTDIKGALYQYAGWLIFKVGGCPVF
jgi:hypothetical protein